MGAPSLLSTCADRCPRPPSTPSKSCFSPILHLLDSRRTWRFLLLPLVAGLALALAFRRDRLLSAVSAIYPDGSSEGVLPFFASPPPRLSPPRKPQWSVSMDGGDEELAKAWRAELPEPEWRSPSPYRLDPSMLRNLSQPSPFAPLAYAGGEEAPDRGVDFCQPHLSWPGRPPTVVLRPYRLDPKTAHSLDKSLRTHLVSTPFAASASVESHDPLTGAGDGVALPNGSVVVAWEADEAQLREHISDVGFLPWEEGESVDKDGHESLVPRIRDAGAPAYVNFLSPTDQLRNRIPPPPPLPGSQSSSDSPSSSSGSHPTTADRLPRAKLPSPPPSSPLHSTHRTAPCLSYDVPAAADRIPTLPPPRFMFGMATNPSRILRSLPVWQDWHSSAPSSSPSSPSPRFFVLTAPPTTSGEAADEVEWHKAKEALERSSLRATMRSLPMGRQEQRYFALVREMWKDEETRHPPPPKEGQHEKRGEEEEKEGEVDWFVLADDDTFFMSLAELARIVVKYDPSVPRIVGAVSENPMQVNTFERIAYGGAGILLNRAMVKLLNRPNFFDECFTRFGHLGGDGMISLCAASAMRKPLKKVLTVEKTLHQFDIGGEAQGFFQAGIRMSTLHHWNSWYSLFPPHHLTALHDDYEAVRLLGRAARGVGVANFGRRYVWGLGDGSSGGVNEMGETVGFDEAVGTMEKEKSTVVLSLGYALTIYAPGEVDLSNLNQVEHSFSGAINLASRPSVREGTLKRSYYIIDAQSVPSLPGVVVLRHANEDGELVDVVWDGRVTGPERKGGEGLSVEALVGNDTGRDALEDSEEEETRRRKAGRPRERRADGEIKERYRIRGW